MKWKNLEHFAAYFAEILGTSWAFFIALSIVIAWLITTGPKEIAEHPRMFLVEFAEMFIFMHLFIMQRAHNKNIKALHVKLDELLASLDGASNKLIKAESAPEAVIDDLHEAYSELAESIEHPTAPLKVERDVEVKRNRAS